MIFYTFSAQHILSRLEIPFGKRTIQQFADGELYVKLEQSVHNKHVWAVGSTIAPAENLVELLLLLDAIQRNGGTPSVLIPYFSYARQDRAAEGEALSAEVMLNCFKQFNLHKMVIVHVHNPAISRFLPFENYIPLPFFTDIARTVDCIVAPDKGAHDLACAVAQHAEKPMVFMQKVRPAQEQAEIVHVTGEVVGKTALLVDDMIATGTTLIKAARALQQRGVEHIYAAATHGLFAGDAFNALEKSPIEKIFITNTIAQKQAAAKITIVDISSLLQTILKG